MKTTTLKSRLILSVAGFAGLMAVAQAWTTPVQTMHAAPLAEQVVTITAKRLTTEEKIAFDTQGQVPQQVIISARKLTEQEKLAFDQAHPAEVAQAYRENDPS